MRDEFQVSFQPRLLFFVSGRRKKWQVHFVFGRKSFALLTEQYGTLPIVRGKPQLFPNSIQIPMEGAYIFACFNAAPPLSCPEGPLLLPSQGIGKMGGGTLVPKKNLKLLLFIIYFNGGGG